MTAGLCVWKIENQPLALSSSRGGLVIGITGWTWLRWDYKTRHGREKSFLPPALKRVFYISCWILRLYKDIHTKGFRDKMLAHTVLWVYIHTAQCNHRHTRAMSMKHLSSNNKVQGIKTGWAREICKTGFQIESLQKPLPRDVGKIERETARYSKRHRERERERDSSRGNCIVDVWLAHCKYTDIYTEARIQRQDFRDGKWQTTSLSVIECHL